MTEVIKEIEINASKDKVWPILADIGSIQNYNPGVTKSLSTSEAKTGIGASRHCDLLPMGSVEERVIEWDEGNSYKIEIYDGKIVPFLGTAVFEVSENGENTHVKMTMNYEMKSGIMASMMGMMMKGKMDKAVESILVGLKHHVETGEEVSMKVYKNLSV
ncbi:MAG: SRPBCC family protein [Candidatus Marinimicrobia bacterium]|nr:SRPBCC family protein [Candidatus Neomarinimicrobiota bacterium]